MAETPQRVVGGPSGLPSVWLDTNVNDQVFYRSREPHPEWVRALRQISPKSDVHGWLFLDWDPGEPCAPRQRWVLDELVDPRMQIEYKGKWGPAVDPAIVEELEGPHPRSSGHMCHWNVPEQFQCLCRRKFGAWRGGPCQLITLRQYQLYQRTGHFALPFWTIQGGNGGHQASYNSIEKEWLQQQGLPTSPAGVGEWHYAPFDGRVTANIVRHNRLLALDGNLSAYRKQQGSGYQAHRSAQQKEMRRQWVAFLEHQSREEAADFQDAYRKGEIEKGGTTADWEKIDEMATNEFIETGRMRRTHAYL